MKQESFFEKYREGNHWDYHPTIYAESFASFLKQRKFDGIVVDLGCGSGRDADVFTRFGFDSIGLDNQSEVIKKAKEKYPKTKFVLQDMEDLQFKDGSIGAFYTINAFNYIDPKKVLGLIRNKLKKGGYLHIHFDKKIVDKYGKIDISLSLEEIDKLISGFRVLSKRHFERLDERPVEHRHFILELTLQKT